MIYKVTFMNLIGFDEAAGCFTGNIDIPGIKPLCLVKLHYHGGKAHAFYDGDDCFFVPIAHGWVLPGHAADLATALSHAADLATALRRIHGVHPPFMKYKHLLFDNNDLEFIREEIAESFQF